MLQLQARCSQKRKKGRKNKKKERKEKNSPLDNPVQNRPVYSVITSSILHFFHWSDVMCVELCTGESSIPKAPDRAASWSYVGRKGKLSLRIGFYSGQDELLPFQDRQGLVWSICHLVASWPPLAIVLEKTRWATVRGVRRSPTWLSDWMVTSHSAVPGARCWSLWLTRRTFRRSGSQISLGKWESLLLDLHGTSVFSLAPRITISINQLHSIFKLSHLDCFSDFLCTVGSLLPLLLWSSIIPMDVHELIVCPLTVMPACRGASTELPSDAATPATRAVPMDSTDGVSLGSSCGTQGAHLASNYVFQRAHFPWLSCCCSVGKSCLALNDLTDFRILCPWNSPGKNTGVGCHFLLQGIFPIQGLTPCLLHWQVGSSPLRHREDFSISSYTLSQSNLGTPPLLRKSHCLIQPPKSGEFIPSPGGPFQGVKSTFLKSRLRPMNSWIFDLCSGSHNQARVWCCIGTGAIGVNSWFLIYWYRYKYRCLYVYKYLRFLLLYLEMTQVYWHLRYNQHTQW